MVVVAGQGAGAGDGSFMNALANIESWRQEHRHAAWTRTAKENSGAGRGNASENQPGGHFQINTATWRDFAKQAKAPDINQYPNAMSAPRAVLSATDCFGDPVQPICCRARKR